MNATVTVRTGKSKEVKGLTAFKATHLKTQTKLEVTFSPDMECYAQAAEDLKLLGLKSSPVKEFLLTVEGAPALGRIVNRSIGALGRIGIQAEEIGWEDEAGVVPFSSELGLTTDDLPSLVDLVFRMADRASQSMGYTHHPLTLYDLKQTTGLVWEAKQDSAQAKAIIGWAEIRELTILEEIKEEKAKARKEARAKAKKDSVKKKTKTEEKPDPQGKAANLADLT